MLLLAKHHTKNDSKDLSSLVAIRYYSSEEWVAVKSAPVQITHSIFLPDLFKTICGKMLSNLAISFTNWHTGMAYSCGHYRIDLFFRTDRQYAHRGYGTGHAPTKNMAEFLQSNTSLCLTKLRKQGNLEVLIINQEICIKQQLCVQHCSRYNGLSSR